MKIAEGLIVAIITPKLGTAIDKVGLKKLTDHVINSGVNGIFVLGTTGESRFLTPMQKAEVIKTVAEANQKRVFVVVGASAETLDETREIIRLAEENHADALVLAPLVGQGTVDEKIEAVLSYSPLPIILYNNPALTDHENMDLSAVAEYSRNPRIIGIKDSSGDPEYFAKLLQMANDDFTVLQGREKPALTSLLAGAAGLVSGSSNVLTKEFRALLDERTQESQDEVLRLKSEMGQMAPNPIMAMKRKLVQAGVISSDEMFL